jgi:carboxymethylenebutenolidase
MCFSHDSRPPIPPMAGGAVASSEVVLEAADGNRFRAFEARADDRAARRAIIVLPDVRGLHPYYEELALRFAEAGIDALAIDYFGRTAGTRRRGDDFEHLPHVEQTTYDGLSADVAAAAEHLSTEGDRARRLFTIGFCMGGRLAFLTATQRQLRLTGAIGFYGGPTGPGRAGMPAPVDVADTATCPVLGIFGGADREIPAEALAALEASLERAGVEHETVSYPGAPHSFFDRKQAEFADESADAWRRVLAFIERHSAIQAGARLAGT